MKSNPSGAIWGIIGLGWLGAKLNMNLRQKGFSTWGTQRHEFNFLHDDFPKTPCDLLFLNTPPLHEISAENYVQKIDLSNQAQLIFISSTSVFGNNVGDIFESTNPEPKTNSAIWLVKVESLLKERFGQQVSIIRPGGLIGGERHPARFLSGKKLIPGGQSSINLIHREDLIGLIQMVAEAPVSMIHAVADHHPTKSIYYSEWCQKLGLEPMTFTNEESDDRRIFSELAAKIYPHWVCPKLDFI